MDYARPDLADALAAQYVAGTLRGPARRRFEALLPGHPQLQTAVAQWQGRLMPLTAAVAPEAPPARVWAGIQQRLWPAAAAAQGRWWQRLALWRSLSALATTVAVVLALSLSVAPEVQPPIVVVLQGTGSADGFGGAFVASLSGDGRALVARPLQPVTLQADRALELWAVPPEGQGPPRSLGLISAQGATLLRRDRLPATLLSGQTALLAVSVEPRGGSPTGVPTGPVVYAGPLTL